MRLTNAFIFETAPLTIFFLIFPRKVRYWIAMHFNDNKNNLEVLHVETGKQNSGFKNFHY